MMWIMLTNCLDAIRAWLSPRLKVLIREGDTLPAAMPKQDLILLQDDGENWSVGFRCPCGCEEVIELLLLPNVKPRWDMKVNNRGRPTLSPSVWKKTGCRSHFWIVDGKVSWVRST
jgi:hypothetical protein